MVGVLHQPGVTSASASQGVAWPSVVAVVVHHENWPDVTQVLDALAAQSPPPVDIVVVDDASRDGSTAELRRTYGDVVHFVARAENGGYGAAANDGLRHALSIGADAVLVVTHEVLLAPDALQHMMAALRGSSSIGCVGPLLTLRSRPGLVWSAGGGLGRRTRRPFHIGANSAVVHWADADVAHVAWLDGAALLLRAEALREVGLFREDFFLYYEEVELLSRLRRDGWHVVCQRAARA